MSLKLLCFLVIYGIWNIFAQEMTEDLILKLRRELIEAFEDSGTKRPLIGRAVRLTFHDCGGSPENDTTGIISICDGCIALNSPDHLGLEGEDDDIINVLDDIYSDSDNEWSTMMSTADFWAAAGTIAVQYAQFLDRVEHDGVDDLPFIPYYFGREDCSTSPNVNESTTNIKVFPQGSSGWDDIFEWMSDNLELNTEESVALIGAHTLGQAHEDVSGFENQWVTDWDAFNNQFYIDLSSETWQQVTVEDSGKMQWSRDDLDIFMMLNNDIALWKDIDSFINDTTTGRVTCEFDDCPRQNDTADFVLMFANDNALWLKKFVNAYIKLITMGYDDDELLRIDVNIPIDFTTTNKPTSTPDEDDDEFDFMDWLTENWLYVVLGAVIVLILCICLIICCRLCRKKKERNNRNVQMFGQDAGTFTAAV
eukprot:250776_1